MAEDAIEVRPGPTPEDPYEVRQYDVASGAWSEWIEQGEFIRRIRGKPGDKETARRVNTMVKEDRKRKASEAVPAPIAAEDLTLLEKRDRLRSFLKQYPGTRLMDLEQHQDAERGPLFILAKKLLQRGELLEHPKTKALMFKDQQPAGDEPGWEISVRILEDLPPIRDSDGNDRRLIRGELVRLPDSTARALLRRGKAEEVLEVETVPEDVPTAAPEASASTPVAEQEIKAELAGDGVTNGEPDLPPLPMETLPKQPEAEATQPAVHPGIAEAERINELLARGRGDAMKDNSPEIQSPEPAQICSGYSVDLAEPYIDADGSPAVAVIYNGRHLKLWKLSEWKDAEPSLYKELCKRFFPDRGHRWKYPSRPIVPESYEDLRGVNGLHAAIVRCTEHYVEFSHPDWPSVFATWIMGSYLVPFLSRSPILPIYGVTGSGKGQVLDQVDRLAYRGKKMIDPTPAVLYRLADRWKMTFALDEIQDKDKDSFREVLSIVKGSYDGTSVYRCDTNNDVEEFQTRSFFAISFKDHHPPEDVKNRGVQLTMQQNGASKRLVPDDSPEHIDLRARLMGLRLKALSDPEFLQEALRKVQELGTPEALGFDRRPRDIAVSLLVPAVICCQERELIEIVRKSSTEAKDANNSTFEARAQHAYEELLNGLKSVVRYYPVLTIRAHLEELLQAEGELRDDQKLPTRRVTDAFKTLGYELVRRSGNDPFIDREAEQNIKAFKINRAKYTIEGDDLEAP